METKICKKCGIEKEIIMFPREMRKNDWYYHPMCKLCMKETKSAGRILYRENNKEKLREDKRRWYQNNKKEVIVRTSIYKKNNREKYNSNVRDRRKNDPIFQLRDNVRSIIKQMLIKNYGSKNGSSISNYLPYSIQELKKYLESQFESWMTWDNCGRYDVNTWNDNDQSTWTWQLDHIVPQSDLPYTSMQAENFKKCWDLENLRPLAAKQNIVEGSSRSRHKRNE